MKVCLINSNLNERILPNSVINFETGILSLGAVLENAGHEVKVVNLFRIFGKDRINNRGFSSTAAASILKYSRGAGILGFNTRCDTYPVVLEVAKNCKTLDPGRVIVLGGPQSGSTDRETLRNFHFVDIIVRGEGERTFLELTQALEKCPGAKLDGIPGITFRRRGKIIRNKPRGLIKDLGSLPFPAYHLVEDFCLTPAEKKEGWIYVSTGRGCCRDCSYCAAAGMWQRCYRGRPPEDVIGEIDFLKKKYGVNRFYLGHDNFLIKQEGIAEICRLLLKKKTGIEWACGLAAEGGDPVLLKIMSEAGCRRIFLGVESGSRRVQKAIRKNADFSNVADVLKKCRQYNISAVLFFTLGFPVENDEDLNATLMLAIKSRIMGDAYPYLHPLVPIAGTEVFLKNSGKMVLRKNWLNFSPLAGLIKRSSWCKSVIRRHPRVFSNFYAIRNKKNPSGFPSEAADIFSVFLSAYPASLFGALSGLRVSPLLFLRWFKSWARERTPQAQMEKGVYPKVLLLDYFPVFLDNIYKKKNISIGPVSGILSLEKRKIAGLCRILRSKDGKNK